MNLYTAEETSHSIKGLAKPCLSFCLIGMFVKGRALQVTLLGSVFDGKKPHTLSHPIAEVAVKKSSALRLTKQLDCMPFCPSSCSGATGSNGRMRNPIRRSKYVTDQVKYTKGSSVCKRCLFPPFFFLLLTATARGVINRTLATLLCILVYKRRKGDTSVHHITSPASLVTCHFSLGSE